MITVPRYVVVGLAALFSVYQLVLATISIGSGSAPEQYVIAMVIYATAMVLSLWPSRHARMSLWLAVFNMAVCIALPLLVSTQLEPDYLPGSDRETWYVAGIGTLMVVTAVRRRQEVAWLGVASLVILTIVWAGPEALVSLGVVGSVLWVAVSHALLHSLDRAGRDARGYALAEREAAEWQAAQDAHLFERQYRLEHTRQMAMPMLQHILESRGELTEATRQECLYLEGAIRDEIRGRTLLSDRVREQVMAARRRGTIVNLLDEGGIDDLLDDDRERVHNQLATAIRDTTADLIIARTVPGGSDIAVTVVALRSTSEGEARALGNEVSGEDEDEVVLWLEIPRVAQPVVD